MVVKAAIYARISRDDVGDGAGVARQQADCQAVCERRGWSVEATLVDNDVSAFSGKQRPGYQSLIGLISAQAIDVVVAWAPERLHRSPRELEDFIQLVERTGTSVETLKAGTWDVSSSHGRLVARMLGAVSRAESERIGERVSRAHQQAKSEGLWRGPIPYGMRKSDQPGRPEPDPQTADVVRQLFDRIIRGESLCALARDLNHRGIRPRRGSAWTHTGVDRLLASPALGGLIESEGELRAAAFTGVVPANEWRTAKAALRRRPRGELRRPREKLTLLGGLIRCDEHDCVCYGGGTDYGQSYQSNAPGLCYITIPRPPVDDFVTAVVIERLSRPDAAAAFAVPKTVSTADNEVEELELRRQDLADLVADGLLPLAVARSRLEGISERLAAIETQRAPQALPRDAFQNPAEAWSRWTVTQRRDVLRVLFRAITLKHARPKQGPRTDLTRLTFHWADDGSVDGRHATRVAVSPAEPGAFLEAERTSACSAAS